MSRHTFVYEDNSIPEGMTLQEWRAMQPKPPTFMGWLLRKLGWHMTDDQYEATMRHMRESAGK